MAGRRRVLRPCRAIGLERPGAAQLADVGQDAIELTQDEHWPLDALGLPAGNGFQRSQHFVKSIAQVRRNMIAIQTDTVADMNGCDRDDNENGARLREAVSTPLARRDLMPRRHAVTRAWVFTTREWMISVVAMQPRER